MNLEEYIEDHITAEPEELTRIDRETNLRYVNGRMCSGHIQGRLLKMMATMIKPSRVLELGTFTGYSALCIAEGLEGDATIDTIEINDEMEEPILENLSRVEAGKRVKLHIGDAIEIMRNFGNEEFDLIFIDADKRKYSEYFLQALPLLKAGGYMIIDNTLWDGHVIEETKHSSMTSGVMAFNDLLTTFPGIETAMIPFRDGMTIVRKLP